MAIDTLRRGPTGRRIRVAATKGLRAIAPSAHGGWLPAEEGNPVNLIDVHTGKYCLECESWQPIASFYTDRAKADGLGAYCAECMRARATGMVRLASIGRGLHG